MLAGISIFRVTLGQGARRRAKDAGRRTGPKYR